MKNLFQHITSWFAMLLLSIGAVLYPYWLYKGILDNWYLILALPVVIYGGLIANIIWYDHFLKRK
jgi:hypothetical protein